MRKGAGLAAGGGDDGESGSGLAFLGPRSAAVSERAPARPSTALATFASTPCSAPGLPLSRATSAAWTRLERPETQSRRFLVATGASAVARKTVPVARVEAASKRTAGLPEATELRRSRRAVSVAHRASVVPAARFTAAFPKLALGEKAESEAVRGVRERKRLARTAQQDPWDRWRRDERGSRGSARRQR